MNYDNYSPKKRVTKNDKKEKGSIYSSKHIRLTLKRLEQQSINGQESEGIDREGVCPAKIGGMAKPKKNHAHRK
jgi:hypothetical protein